MIKKIKNNFRYIKGRPLSQTFNYFMNIIERYTKPIHTTSKPIFATIIIESVCNQNCKFCIWHAKDTERPYWHVRLSLEEFKKQVDILLKNGISHIHICGTGEPLLNKNVVKMIEYLKTKENVTYSIMSNFSKILQDKLPQLANLGLSYISTDIDSGNQKQSLEYYDNTNDTETIRKGISLLNDEIIKAGSRTKICIDSIVTKDNYRYIEDIIKICMQFETITNLSLNDLIPFGFNNICSKDNVIAPTDKDIIKFINNIIDKYKDKVQFNIEKPASCISKKSFTRCSNLWYKIMINLPNDKMQEKDWIGNVSLSCDLTHNGDAYTLGNLNKNSLSEIWNGQKVKHLRKCFKQNKLEICNTCMYK